MSTNSKRLRSVSPYDWVNVPIPRTPPIKAQITAFARARGRSVAFIFREAVAEYMKRHASDRKVAQLTLIDLDTPAPKRKAGRR